MTWPLVPGSRRAIVSGTAAEFRRDMSERAFAARVQFAPRRHPGQVVGVRQIVVGQSGHLLIIPANDTTILALSILRNFM